MILMDYKRLKELFNDASFLIEKDGFVIDPDSIEFSEEEGECYIIYTKEFFRCYFHISENLNQGCEVEFGMTKGTLDFELNKVWTEEELFNKFFDCLKDFHKKVDSIVKQDKLIPRITKSDCDLFLVDGNYDGFSAGLIQYQGSLMYFKYNIPIHERLKGCGDYRRSRKLWRSFYVYELTKEELEQCVMSSLDWMRNINLTSLYKDWKKVPYDVKDLGNKDAHFNGPYRNYTIKLEKKYPVAVLEIFYGE